MQGEMDTEQEGLSAPPSDAEEVSRDIEAALLGPSSPGAPLTDDGSGKQATTASLQEPDNDDDDENADDGNLQEESQVTQFVPDSDPGSPLEGRALLPVHDGLTSPSSPGKLKTNHTRTTPVKLTSSARKKEKSSLRSEIQDSDASMPKDSDGNGEQSASKENRALATSPKRATNGHSLGHSLPSTSDMDLDLELNDNLSGPDIDAAEWKKLCFQRHFGGHRPSLRARERTSGSISLPNGSHEPRRTGSLRSLNSPAASNGINGHRRGLSDAGTSFNGVLLDESNESARKKRKEKEREREKVDITVGTSPRKRPQKQPRRYRHSSSVSIEARKEKKVGKEEEDGVDSEGSSSSGVEVVISPSKPSTSASADGKRRRREPKHQYVKIEKTSSQETDYSSLGDGAQRQRLVESERHGKQGETPKSKGKGKARDVDMESQELAPPSSSRHKAKGSRIEQEREGSPKKGKRRDVSASFDDEDVLGEVPRVRASLRNSRASRAIDSQSSNELPSSRQTRSRRDPPDMLGDDGAQGAEVELFALGVSYVPPEADDDLPQSTIESKRKGKEKERDSDAEEELAKEKERDSDAEEELAKEKEIFVPMSTSTQGPQLSVAEMIRKMREAQASKLGIELAAPSARTDETRDEMLDGPMLLGATNRDSRQGEEDEEEDEKLEDASALIAKTKAYKPPPKPAKPALPVDKSKYSLHSLIKAKHKEEDRGWFGVEAAQAAFEEAEGRAANGTGQGDLEKSRNRRPADSDDDDESLPDIVAMEGLPPSPPSSLDSPRKSQADSQGTSQTRSGTGSGSAGHSQKRSQERERRLSDGALKRVAGALAGDKIALSAVKSVKDDHQLLAKMSGSTRLVRRFWITDRSIRIKPFEPYSIEGREGFDLAICKGIIAGLADPNAFPVSLFSHFNTCKKAIASSLPVTYSLFHLVAHPNTKPALANRALTTLVTIVQKISLLGPDSSADTDVDLSTVIEAFVRLGARKEEVLQSDLGEVMDTSADGDGMAGGGGPDNASNDGKETFSPEGRRSATMRLLAVLKLLIQTRRGFPDSANATAYFLLRLALDPDSHVIQRSALSTLQALFATLDDAESLSLRSSLFDYIGPMQLRHEQLVVLNLLPIASKRDRAMTRSLAFACLFGRDILTETTLKAPSLTLIRHALYPDKAALATTAFTATAEYDDGQVYYAVLIFQLLLSDTAGAMVLDTDHPDVENRAVAVQARRDMLDIVAYLQRTESRMRTHVRSGDIMRDKAKNALTRLQHSLEYQHHAAARSAAKKAKRGQMSMKGFLVSKAVPSGAASPAVSASPAPSV